MKQAAIDFLTAVNKSLLCLKEKEPKHASSNLIGILEEIFEGTEYKMTFSQKNAKDDLGVKLGKNEPIKICTYIEKVKEKEYKISPFTFWSIFFAYANNPKPKQREEMFKALVNWYDPELKSEVIAKNLIDFRKTKIDEAVKVKGLRSNTLTIEGWIQLVKNLSEDSPAEKCWQLFKELMQDNPDKTEINKLLQNNEDKNGLLDCPKIGKEAVPNILYFIRPDLQFYFDTDGKVTNIIRSEEMEIKNTIELLESSKQIILTGAPGTGKTYHATEVAKEMTEKDGEYKKVQFHPGYDYSDFIIGLKPKVDPDHGQVTFEWKDGVFKEFADKALKAYQQAAETTKGQAEKIKDKEINAKPYIFIIDEINRADLSRVFGEVFSLLEEDYRYPNKEKGITLPSNANFILPPNLYIIGTMNDIDRSVESMDFALRRRFSWKEVTAESSANIIDAKDKDGNFKIANENHRIALQQTMAELNKYIGGEELPIDEKREQKVPLNLGTEYQLGGAYFLNFAKYQKDTPNIKENEPAFESLWNNHIAIILNEYLRGRSNREQILSALKGKYDAAWKGKRNEKNESSADNADVETTSSSTASENKTAEENK